MYYWISLTLNTNAASHIRRVGVNWALLRSIGIVSSTDKCHFLVINLVSEVLQDEDISSANTIKTCGMNILFCLILWTNISHSITTSIPRIVKKSSPHINVRRSSKPVPYYHTSSAIMRPLLSGDIESNPGPVNPTKSNRKRKQDNSFPLFCQECNKTVKANSKRLSCIHCNNLVHLKCIGTNSAKRLKSYDRNDG